MSRTNILVLMVDQLNGTLFPDGPAGFVQAPTLRALAARSVRFANAYCASPLCAPSRAAFMTGRMPSALGVYDNAAELRPDAPTFAHHLRRAGYRTVLSGKMHFVGPDQLHGFEERLTTDIYPADFGWTPDWERPTERVAAWWHNFSSVAGAGVAEITNQLDYDDEVAARGQSALYRLARAGAADGRPFLLTVSFTHPHDPYVARRRFWELYEDVDIPAPPTPPLVWEEHDPHSRRLLEACDWRAWPLGPETAARARRAYLASLSYLDDKIAGLLGVLEDCGLTGSTAVVFCADHGDMLGDRGLWFKMSFYEGSARVPIMLAAPDVAPGRVDAPVSLTDVAPTLTGLAGIGPDETAPFMDGASLLPLARGAPREAPVLSEYAAEAAVSPMVMLRRGRFKLVLCEADPPQLFDLAADPAERRDLAADPAHAETFAALEAEARARWDLAAFDRAVRGSQARRRLVYEAQRQGVYAAWDYDPPGGAAGRYMRNHLDLDALETGARFPQEGPGRC